MRQCRKVKPAVRVVVYLLVSAVVAHRAAVAVSRQTDVLLDAHAAVRTMFDQRCLLAAAAHDTVEQALHNSTVRPQVLHANRGTASAEKGLVARRFGDCGDNTGVDGAGLLHN